jgi:hypothetical protein
MLPQSIRRSAGPTEVTARVIPQSEQEEHEHGLHRKVASRRRQGYVGQEATNTGTFLLVNASLCGLCDLVV